MVVDMVYAPRLWCRLAQGGVDAEAEGGAGEARHLQEDDGAADVGHTQAVAARGGELPAGAAGPEGLTGVPEEHLRLQAAHANARQVQVQAAVLEARAVDPAGRAG